MAILSTEAAWDGALDIFGVDDQAARAGMREAADIRKVPPGRSIIAQDDDDQHVFFLLEGEARVVLLSESGQEIWLDAFAAGTIFGEMAALTGAPRSSEIIAESACCLGVFSHQAFQRLMLDHGAIGWALSRTLADRVHNTTQRMFELSALSAPGRVYAELLRMAETLEDAERRIIQPAPSMTELARRVNTTRETASRTVNGLEKRGLLRRSDSRIELIDPDFLHRLRGPG
ncbi:Crp/Fnr family transcriptional regulator [Maricaulis sp. CAU 1757]